MATIKEIANARIALAQRAAIIDEYGKLDAELNAMKPKEKRHEQLRKAIMSWSADLAADEAAELQGSRYSVQISACSMARKIRSMIKLKARLGQKIFFDLCRLSLEELDKRIPVPEIEQFVETTQTGRRSLVVIPKFTEDVEKAA